MGILVETVPSSRTAMTIGGRLFVACAFRTAVLADSLEGRRCLVVVVLAAPSLRRGRFH